MMYLARDISSSDPDHHVRSAALVAIERLSRQHGGRIRWADIQRGFNVGSERIYFATRAQGIFKPKQMSAALSIRTVIPRSGREAWYRDQGFGGRNSDPETGLLRYDLARGGPDESSNRSLRMALERRAPLIYFAGFAPSEYQSIFPVWVEEFRENEVLLATTDSLVSVADSIVRESVERTYSPTMVRARNHQAWFSARTKSAYGFRCAFSGLPVRELLVGAHIISDADGGPASVNNGICMSTLHHSAYDTHLIGVDPDFRVHVAPPLRERQDGDLLSNLKDLDGNRLHLPSQRDDWPDREFLEQRFETFNTAPT
ncbi:MAG: HNH endonuclease [Candidatus Latescibacteria bacterium]|nr:HNH endonuclease [Candidatus Latescibacterota bacterium]